MSRARRIVPTDLLPGWVFADGPDDALLRLADPRDRARVREDMERDLDGWWRRVGPAGIAVASVGEDRPNRQYVGRSIGEAAGPERDPLGFLLDVMLQERMDVRFEIRVSADDADRGPAG